MGNVLIRYKIMPEEIKEDLKRILEEVKKVAEKNKAKVLSNEEQNVAFGLKCLIVTISISEQEETTNLEESLKKIKGVSSIDVIDYRRALE
ncbi:MAG: elongation factor 1-beta [Candidatus Pacearchaeota archaeon]